MKETKGDERRYIRWGVGGQLAGQIVLIPRVSLINISIDGAVIEHSKTVRPGTLCFLTLVFPREEFTLKCRVVRSTLHRSEVWTDGEQDMIYRTEVEFLDTSDTSGQLINEYIDSLKRMSRATRRRKGGRSRLNEPTISEPKAALTNRVSRARKREGKKHS